MHEGEHNNDHQHVCRYDDAATPQQNVAQQIWFLRTRLYGQSV